MKHINLNFLYVLLLAGTALSSCSKDFLDSKDPNSVTGNIITPELIFPATAVAMGDRAASANFNFLNNWMGYFSASGSFAIDQTETSYNLTFSFGDLIWRNHYDLLFDLYTIRNKALDKDDGVLAGAAMVLSAKLWQELVDLYGNIPYSQAFQNDKYTQPVYDNAKDIYASLQASLDEAKEHLGRTAPATFAKIDLIARGKISSWIKFANTLKLRMLIRQSEVPGFDPSPDIDKIKDGGTALNILGPGETVYVNPGYVNESNKQSPFYANYGFTPTGAEANASTRANAYLVNLLNNNSDLRLARIFRAPSGGGAITGTIYGLVTGNPSGTASSGIGEGLAGAATQDQWILTSVESMFLQAEAIARGWAAGDARSVYEAAVSESFSFLGVPDAANAAMSYMANAQIADWSNAGSSVISRVKFIAYQKYIALAGINAQESFADLRRLNMIPNNGYISVNPSRVSNRLPNRIPYPQTEYTTNSANVLAQGDVDIFSDKLFWQP